MHEWIVNLNTGQAATTDDDLPQRLIALQPTDDRPIQQRDRCVLHREARRVMLRRPCAGQDTAL
jgi:hypothetical protein